MEQQNPERWERLVELLEPIHERARLSARRLARSSADGDDLFHDTLLRTYEKLQALREPEHFAAWFYSVLLSVHRNSSRRSFWRRFSRLDEVADTGGGDPDHEQAARMSHALDTLPSVQREAIILCDLDGFSMEEIARMQRVTISAVKTRVARGRKRLRRHYERLGFRPLSHSMNPMAAPEPEGDAVGRSGHG